MRPLNRTIYVDYSRYSKVKQGLGMLELVGGKPTRYASIGTDQFKTSSVGELLVELS